MFKKIIFKKKNSKESSPSQQKLNIFVEKGNPPPLKDMSANNVSLFLDGSPKSFAYIAILRCQARGERDDPQPFVKMANYPSPINPLMEISAKNLSFLWLTLHFKMLTPIILQGGGGWYMTPPPHLPRS